MDIRILTGIVAFFPQCFAFFNYTHEGLWNPVPIERYVVGVFDFLIFAIHSHLPVIFPSNLFPILPLLMRCLCIYSATSVVHIYKGALSVHCLKTYRIRQEGCNSFPGFSAGQRIGLSISDAPTGPLRSDMLWL